ncbi:hypothetical protein BD626DRAFT_429258 [Schizophyllum amplum]|uniref:Uncharacterized protein n=1 Tax=Schizophyllum amplum TaxID=97359 RepID=A0A550CJA2_9AGAR|nr:hypothetical protein BD626DRAFT_429258 [Auriculariopsis ampla]
MIAPAALVLLGSLTVVFASPRDAGDLHRRDDSDGYFNPSDNGGSMLTQVDGTYPEGLGEPLNMIISANSDDDVLVDQKSNGGFRAYFTSIGFGSECLGQVDVLVQRANLGDGNDYANQTSLLRWDYGDANFGTCKESVNGGNHFRYWVQNGTDQNSGAYFIAASYEKSAKDSHDIVTNGYNIARDEIVGNITGSAIDSSSVSDSSTYSGSTSYNGYTWETSVEYKSGLLTATSDGINHYQSVPEDGQPAIDGLVAVLTVRITQRGTDSDEDSNGAHPSHASPVAAGAALLVFGAFALCL